MGELSFTPWRRYGHDRVYVSDGETKVGHLDRTTGALSLLDSARHAEVWDALASAGFVEPVRPAREAEPWAITLPGDTATYRAGAGARRKAAEERAAAPVRARLARLTGAHTDERAWRRGAEGEEEVGRRLRKLPAGWVVLHDLPIGARGANVDHLAIGPGGVFTMNTKNLGYPVVVDGDSIRCGGHRTWYVRSARHEAERVGRILTEGVGEAIAVHGVIVVIAPELTLKAQPRDVTVIARRHIRDWLAATPPTVSIELAARLERVARDPRTWR